MEADFKIVLNDININVIIVRKKIKNIYFRFDNNDDLLISVHPLVSKKEIFNLIDKNKNSIYKMYLNKNKTRELENVFYYLGDEYNIIYKDTKKVYIEDDKIYTNDKKSLDKYYLNKCVEVFNDRVNKIINMFDDIPSFDIRIRKMKTRWGVCNVSSKIITLNSELLKKDVTLIDYVIIHEICHFKYHNHQKEFWNEVEKYYPYYKLARKRLKDL